jgi:DNA replication protein DnaC
MSAPDQDLDALFKRLHLANARRVWRDLVQRAERETWSYGDFLTLLVKEEIAHRQQTRLGRLTRRAHFPFLKTIDDFNFTYQSTLRLHMLGSALAPDFVTEGRSLIFSGKPGRGKTHLAIAVAYRAIQNGFDAVFTTAATLIDDLSAAFRDGQLAQALQAYTHPAVLVVDEVGYLTYGTDAANMLFHVVNERHRHRRSMIFTTNKALKAWGRVLHDEDLGQAIIDRVLERGRLIRLDGPSIRTLHLKLDEALKDDSDQDDEVARISGNKWPEFPEPTYGMLALCGNPIHTQMGELPQLQKGRSNATARTDNQHLIAIIDRCRPMKRLVSNKVIQDQCDGFGRVEGDRHGDQPLPTEINELEKPPKPVNAPTRSPTATSVTSMPNPSTIPMIAFPGTNGTLGANGVRP